MRRLVAIVVVLVMTGACGHMHSSRQPNDVDRWFVASMVPHHRLGVELLEIAQPRVDDVRVRRLVFQMGGYHHSELQHLEHLAVEWGVAEASEFQGHLAPKVLDELRSLSGPQHDAAWLAAMIEHHEGAVAMARRQLGADDRRQQAGRGHPGVLASRA